MRAAIRTARGIAWRAGIFGMSQVFRVSPVRARRPSPAYL
jgi:hypothetical protein